MLRFATFAVLLAFPTLSAAAHHGWAWATNEEFQLSGVVKRVRHGNPHGEMLLGTARGDWTVEIGQPWRNQQAGLTHELVAPGARVTIHGHRSARKGQRLMKAERFVIAGKSYNLYPDRPS